MNKTVALIWTLTIGLFFALGFSSCNGAKAYTKKGAKMESAGMVDQAADYYFTALQKKPAHIDALTGLKRTGQQVLSRILVTFDQAILLNNRQSAIDSFKKAEAYHNKAAAYGVTLLFPESKRAVYENVKNAHVEELYGVATEHLESNRYAESLKLFEEIISLIPAYKDAKKLADYSFCKPAYELGIQAMENNLYRTAYDKFDKVYKRDASFEDASQIREEALIAGRFTIALMFLYSVLI